MTWINKFEESCFKIANLWGINQFLACTAAIPLVGIWRSIYWLSPDLYYLLGFVFIVIIFIVSLTAFRSLPFEKMQFLTIPKLFGVMLAFSFVRFKPTNLITIICLYNLVLYGLNHWFSSRNLWPMLWGKLLQAEQGFFPLQKFLEIWLLHLTAGLASCILFGLIKLFCWII